MRVDGNAGVTLAYTPNSFGEWEAQPEFKEPSLKLSGADDYTQPGKLSHLMSKEQQQVLFENTARNMGDCSEFIKIRHISN